MFGYKMPFYSRLLEFRNKVPVCITKARQEEAEALKTTGIPKKDYPLLIKDVEPSAKLHIDTNSITINTHKQTVVNTHTAAVRSNSPAVVIESPQPCLGSEEILNVKHHIKTIEVPEALKSFSHIKNMERDNSNVVSVYVNKSTDSFKVLPNKSWKPDGESSTFHMDNNLSNAEIVDRMYAFIDKPWFMHPAYYDLKVYLMQQLDSRSLPIVEQWCSLCVNLNCHPQVATGLLSTFFYTLGHRETLSIIQKIYFPNQLENLLMEIKEELGQKYGPSKVFNPFENFLIKKAVKSSTFRPLAFSVAKIATSTSFIYIDLQEKFFAYFYSK